MGMSLGDEGTVEEGVVECIMIDDQRCEHLVGRVRSASIWE